MGGRYGLGFDGDDSFAISAGNDTNAAGRGAEQDVIEDKDLNADSVSLLDQVAFGINVVAGEKLKYDNPLADSWHSLY